MLPAFVTEHRQPVGKPVHCLISNHKLVGGKLPSELALKIFSRVTEEVPDTRIFSLTGSNHLLDGHFVLVSGADWHRGRPVEQRC
jgi:hypothetical protein